MIMDGNKIPVAGSHAFKDQSDPNVVWICDERAELTYGCQCYAKFGCGDGNRPIYVKGVVATKHPHRAKKLAIRFGDGVVVRWFEKADVLRIARKITSLD